MLTRVLCFLSAGILLAQPAADPKDVARKALDLLLAQKYPDLVQLLTPEAKTAYSEAALAKNGAEIASWGTVATIGDPSVRKMVGASIVAIPVKFATQSITFSFSVTDEGLVSGMVHSPADPWQHPPYSKPDSFQGREITIGEGQWKLPGTLSVPTGQGPFPGVVLVHDSGPGNRDETVGAVKVFKDLAEGLASRGVVVLRYEKRTRQYPAIITTKDYTVEQETMEDAGLAAALLRTQPEVKPGRVFLLGYGLGGYVAPRIAEADGKLAGIIIVDANARPLEDVALDLAQYLGVTGPQLAVIKESAAKIKALTAADEDAPPLLGMRGPYLLDLKDYNPAGQAKLLGIPMLILQGERDFQVTMKDFNLWKSGLQGQRTVTFKSYPALDHVLVAGQGKSMEADYRKPGQHVAQDVVDDVAKWVSQ
ncbi:MAG TPA: dienelactone hydrolase family protein [Bryobacteraceae bacterium]|nr:dienelactone hydrolase family protein [Bryobacteraceae bacterium]